MVAAFVEPAGQRDDLAVGDENAVGTGRRDCLVELGPVGVVGNDEAAIQRKSSFVAPDRHPTGGVGNRYRGEFPERAGSGGSGGKKDHRAAELLFGGVCPDGSFRKWKPLLAKCAADLSDSGVNENRADGEIEEG